MKKNGKFLILLILGLISIAVLLLIVKPIQREKLGVLKEGLGSTEGSIEGLVEGLVGHLGYSDTKKEAEVKIDGGVNTKDISKYSQNEIFLISDKNWRDVLSLVPVTIWTEGMETDQPGPRNLTIKKYPTLVYHEEGDAYQNYALNKPATASNNAPGWLPEYANDGKLDTGWCSLQKDVWWQVDLTAVKTINRIEIETDHNYNFVSISGSLDGRQYFSITSGELKFGFNRIDFNSIETRYIQVLFSSDGDAKTIMEFKAFNINEVAPGKNSFDLDSTINFMQIYWKSDVVPAPKKLTIIGPTPTDIDNLLVTPPDLGPGLQEEQIQRIYPRHYFSYWQSFKEVVAVDYQDYKAGPIASTYASLINAPLVFINDSNIGELDGYLSNKNVYFISSKKIDCSNNCPEAYYLKILAISNRVVRDDIERLQRKYIELTNTDKIILTNPNDKDFYLQASFQPERSSLEFYNLFNNHSLVAPILASAKHELIIFNDLSVSPTNHHTGQVCLNNEETRNNINSTDNFVKNTVNSLFASQNKTPRYLTILASPQAIPDSICSEEGSNLRYEQDVKYAIEPNPGYSTYGPSIAIDSQNNLNMAWVDGNSYPPAVYYQKRDRQGNALSEPIKLMMVGDNSNIIIDSHGNIHIIASGNYIRFDNLEQRWGKPISGLYSDQFIMDDDENFHTIFWYGLNNIIYRKIDNLGNIVGQIDLGQRNGPGGIIKDFNNDVYVSWIGPDHKLSYSKIDHNGRVVFTNNSLLELDGGVDRFLVVADHNNNINIFAQSWLGDLTKVFYKQVDDQGSILIDKVLIYQSQPNNSPRILSTLVDQNNVINFFWDEGGTTVYYWAQFVNNRLINKTQIADNENIAIIRVDNQGNILVLWRDRYSVYKNNQWQHITGGGKDLAIDSENNPFIVSTTGNLRRSLIFFAKLNNQSWQQLGSIYPGSIWNLEFGRIYGITSSDASSYLAKSIFYNQLFNNLYPGESTGFSIGRECYGSGCAQQALVIKTATTNSGYKSYCSSYYSNGCDHIGQPIPPELMLHKQYITYCDHSGPTRWVGLSSTQIPWLDLPHVFSASCSSNYFWIGRQLVLGANFIRKGAIAYHGSTGASTTNVLGSVLQSLKKITEGNQISLGQLNTFLLNFAAEDYYTKFIMLGDPTLVPNFKTVNW